MRKWAESVPADHQLEGDARLQRRFGRWADKLRTKGVFAGTSHKRIVIPKRYLNEDSIKSLGFQPVVVAIPEAGQDRFESFRHPNNLFHIHSHGDRWTMHEDSHPAATMLMQQGVNPVKAVLQGIPHVVTEGAPGLANFLGGVVKGRESTADAVLEELKGAPKVAGDATKKVCCLTFKIDRPKGTVKTWGEKSFTYPCDYGYFPGVDGEDGEGLDAFVGDHPDGHYECFQKLKPGPNGVPVLDETKFLVAVDDATREKIYALYGDEVHARQVLDGVHGVKKALGKFKGAKKERYVEKKAGYRTQISGEMAKAMGGLSEGIPEKMLNSVAEGDVPYQKVHDAAGKVRVNHAPMASPMYHPLTDEIYMPSRPGSVNLPGISGMIGGKGPIQDSHALAHEIGHSRWARQLPGKVLQSVPGLLAAKPLVAGGIGIQQGLSDNENPATRAALYTGLAQIPLLASEAAATIHGHKIMKSLGASAGEMSRYRRGTGGAYSTYVLQSLGNIGGSAALAKILSGHRHQNEEQKMANEEETPSVLKDRPHWAPILPFGSTWVGYQRGKGSERAAEGVARGIAGGIGGNILGRLPGAALNNQALALLGGVAGDIAGTHYATRGLLDQKKEASLRGARAVLAALKVSDVKAADIDKLLHGSVIGAKVPGLTGSNGPAEAASDEDKLMRVFRDADAKVGPSGEESGLTLPQEGTLGL